MGPELTAVSDTFTTFGFPMGMLVLATVAIIWLVRFLIKRFEADIAKRDEIITSIMRTHETVVDKLASRLDRIETVITTAGGQGNGQNESTRQRKGA